MKSGNPKLRLNVLTALAVAGLGIAGFLSYHYYQVRSGAAGFHSFCNLGEKMNCDVVAASSYAELIGGIPLSSFGAGWYLAILIVAILARMADWRREASRGLLFLTGFGLLMSAYYLFVMVFLLKTYCVLCLGLDAVGVVSFFLAYSLKSEWQGHKADPSSWKSIAGIVGACLLVSVLTLKGMDSAGVQESNADEIAASVLARPVLPVKTSEDFSSFGPKDAPITITEFADFQCPSCRMGALMMKSVLLRYPKQVRVVFRNFPLDAACNRMMEGHRGHPFACEAARAGVCAHKQGKFASYYEETFGNQDKLAEGKPAEFARNVGVDPAQFDKCVKSDEAQSVISRDIEEAVTLGVQSTPTFFINGHKVEGAYPVEVWSKMIDQLLKTR